MSIKHSWLAAVAIAGVAIAPGSALATKLVGVAIQGRVTAVSGIQAVTIDGTQYPVKSGSQAAQALPQLAPGQLVTIVLDGPASSTAHVIAVHTTTAGN